MQILYLYKYMYERPLYNLGLLFYCAVIYGATIVGCKSLSIVSFSPGIGFGLHRLFLTVGGSVGVAVVGVTFCSYSTMGE